VHRQSEALMSASLVPCTSPSISVPPSPKLFDSVVVAGAGSESCGTGDLATAVPSLLMLPGGFYHCSSPNSESAIDKQRGWVNNCLVKTQGRRMERMSENTGVRNSH
jgi:hypothetical protein